MVVFSILVHEHILEEGAGRELIFRSGRLVGSFRREHVSRTVM